MNVLNATEELMLKNDFKNYYFLKKGNQPEATHERLHIV